MDRTAAFLHRHRLVVVGGAALVFMLLFPRLYLLFEDGVVTFAMLPVMLAGGLYGLRVGLVFGLSAFLVNLVLAATLVSGKRIGLPDIDGMLAGSAMPLLLGAVIGYLSDLRKRLSEELINRKQVETALRVSEHFNQAVLQALSANIAVLNRMGDIVAVNDSWKKFASDNGAQEGRTGVGMNYLKVCRTATGESGEIAARTADGIQAVLEGRESLFTLEYPCHSPRHKRWFVLYVTPLTFEQGGAVVSHINITDRVLSEQKLAFLATHDALTGLYNRAFFEQELARLREEQSAPVTFVMADVDGLKKVNDQQGHAAGDELLRRAGEVLRSAFRDQDTLARVGGDEFAVILPGVDAMRAVMIRERVAARLRDAAGQVSLSLGMATAQNSEEIPAAVKAADERMYQEKAERKS